MSESILLGDFSSSYDAGQMTGRLIVLVLFAAGVAKCASLMRREKTSSLCVSALMIFLLAGLLNGTALIIRDLWNLPSWVTLVTSLIAAMGLIISIALAVAGLVVYRMRPGAYNQGRAQAVWTLCLCMLALIIGAAAFVSKAGEKGDVDDDSGPMATTLEFKESAEYAEFNFRFGKPSRPWMPFDIVTANEASLASYTRALPESYAMVVAESNAAQLDRTSLKSVIEARLEGFAKRMEMQDETTRQISGITFSRLAYRVEGLNGLRTPLHYEIWISCTTRHAYTFSFWSPWKDRTSLKADANAFMDTFALIEPAEEARGAQPFPDHEAPAEGYATALQPLGWIEASEETFLEACVIATKNDQYLCLIDMPLPPKSKARPEEIDDALLGMLNLKESERPSAPEVSEHTGMPARVYAFRRKHANQDFDFRARILQSNTRAWMLVTWGEANLPMDMREQAARAIRIFPPDPMAPARELPPRLVKARGLFLNSLGVALHRRQDYAQAELHFREAMRLQPEDSAVVTNVVEALEQQSRFPDALAVLTEEALPSVRELPEVRARRARLLAATGKPDEAATEWKALFDGGHANEDDLLTAINLTLELDRPAEALARMQAFAEAHPSARVNRWHASVLARNDRFDDALRLLEPPTATQPPDIEALYLKAELENDAGRYEAAESSTAALLAAGEDSPRTHLIRGWSHWHRKAWKEAREAFSRASEKAPEDPSIKEALAMTAGALGQGTAEVSTTPLKAVEIPDELVKALADQPAPPESLLKGQGAHYLHRFLGVHYQPGEPVRVTHFYKVKVSDQRGIEAFSDFTQLFHPASESVYVNRLVVTDDTGAVLQEGTNADAFTTGESGDQATGARILHVPVPGLRKGCTVEAIITVQDKSKSTTPPTRRDLMAGGFPALARAWFLSGDSTGMRFSHAPSVRPLETADGRVFVTYQTAAFRSESFMAPLEQWQPWVVAGPADTQWKKLASDYLDRLGDRLKEDGSTRELATRLCQGLKTREEKLGAIVRHVQSTLTYKALEFGTRALIPSPVAKIQADQYGDCKDHTLLLHHLLRRAGITSHLALVDTRWQIRRDIASLDQFDHMILHVPGVGDQPWIDATSDWLDLARFSPDSLAGRDALVLDPANPRFLTIPASRTSLVRVERESTLQDGGHLAVKESVTLDGAAAAWTRSWMLDYPAGERANLIRRQLDGYGHFELSSFDVDHADLVSHPLVLRLEYVIHNAFDPATRQITLPFYWELDFLSVAQIDNRMSPISLNPSLTVESRHRLVGLPEGSGLGEGIPVRGRTPAGSWELNAEPTPDAIVVTFTSQTLRGDHPVPLWPEFEADRRSLTGRLRRPFTLAQ